MKILVFNWQCIKNPSGGGAEVHFHEIFKRIAVKGHDVTLFCSKFEGANDEEIIDGIRVIRKGSRSLFNFYVKKEYLNNFKHKKFDIVIDDINKIPFYTPRYVTEPLMAISHHFFGKSIYRETNFLSGTYVYLAEKLVDSVYKNTHFAVVSQSTMEEFIGRGFNPELFSIVPNAIAQELFPMKVGEKYSKPTVTYFGRLKKYKSVDHLVKAFALVRKEIPDAQLHFLGRGDFRPYLEKLTKELGIENCTKFFGFISEEDKVKYLSLAHCVVNTSMKEGWGITNIEANACGTPVISADVPGLRDSVLNDESGLLYKYGNIQELAKLLINVLKDNNLRERLSHGAVNWAKSFSWDKSADLMLEKIDKVIHEQIS
jgi:glycosyltransferase involved in cell wall biosynthesis